MNEVVANGWDEPAKPAVSRLPRAPTIDEFDGHGPCEICAGWRANKYHKDPDDERRVRYACDECGGIIPYVAIKGGRGSDTITPHHYHLRPIKDVGVPAKVSIQAELCDDCLREHRAKVYPHESPETRELYLNPNGLPRMPQ